MSITSEITRINTNIASAYTACSNKGATMPVTQNSANLATTISSISGGGGGGATIYNSETEMNSSTGHSDGDLANVYQVPSSVTSSSSFRYGFFPDKVVLSQAITSTYSIDFEGDEDQFYNCYLSQNYVSFNGSDADYNDVEITYRSKDGLTFFRINGEDYLDLGAGTHKTTGQWVDACGSFIKIGDEVFGFYRYGHSVEDKTQQKIPIASNTTFDSTNLTCTCTLTGGETVIDGDKLQELIKKAFVKFDIPELDYMGIFTKSDGVYACYYKRVLSNNRTFYGGINTRCINSTGTNFTDYVMDANGQMGTNQTFTLYYFKLDFENMDISAQTSVTGEMHQTGVGYYNFPMFEVTGMTSAPAYFIVKSKYLLAGEAHTSDINSNTASVFTTSPSMIRTYDGFEKLANNKN